MSGTVQSVERAAAIMRLLVREPRPMTLAQISETLGLAKGTAHGLLRTLLSTGFVSQDHRAGPYRLALELLTIDREPVDLNELRSLCINWADSLAARSGQTVLVAAMSGEALTVAHHVFRPGKPGQTVLTGQVMPWHASAVGKVLCALDPVARRLLPPDPLEAFTFHTATDHASLLRSLVAIRERGWGAAVSEWERDRAEIAAAIRDRDGVAIAAVGIFGPLDDICDARGRPRAELVTEVLRAAGQISAELGYGRGDASSALGGAAASPGAAAGW